MNSMILCNKGIESEVSLEIKELLGKTCEEHDGFVLLECSSEELCVLCYMSQTIDKVILLLDSFSYTDEKEFIKKVTAIDYSPYIDDSKTFKSEVTRAGCTFEKDTIRGKIAACIGKNVSLNTPDIVVHSYLLSDHAYIGIDFSHESLSKRSYRIFSSARNIKSSLAAAMLIYSGYKRGKSLIDPFCLSGTIPIEAALYENKFPVRYFDKKFAFDKFITFDYSSYDKKRTTDKGSITALDAQFKNVDSSKKNAKIAGVHKAISFSRSKIDWIDTKFKEGSVDYIVTCLPNPNKHTNMEEFLKIYDEFFHQVEYILSSKGTCVVCCRIVSDVISLAKEYKLKVVSKKEVWQGQDTYWFVKITK